MQNPLQIRRKIILGSGSPRRRQILEGLGIPFEVTVLSTDESFPEELSHHEVPVFLAQKKANEFKKLCNDDSSVIIITADTVVSIRGEILNKPSDRQEAIGMLEKLSGTSHEVITGVCISSRESRVSFAEKTTVYFRQLERTEIEYYVNAFQPFDKAGSYGVQEWVGYVGMEKIEGSFYNVMGLPISAVYNELRKFSIS
jgi:septum formation protein